jgi:hypothetical protein
MAEFNCRGWKYARIGTTLFSVSKNTLLHTRVDENTGNCREFEKNIKWQHHESESWDCHLKQHFDETILSRSSMSLRH